MAKEIELDMGEAVSTIDVVVKLKRKRWFEIRLHIGLFIIALGAYIAGLGYEEKELSESYFNSLEIE